MYSSPFFTPMTNRDKVSSWLASALPQSPFDSVLRRAGFTRRIGSLIYCRQQGEIDQKLKLLFDVNPNYEPTALAHVLPQVVLESTSLGEFVQQMVDGDPNLAGSSNSSAIMMRHQLQNIAPMEHQSHATRWFIHNEVEVPPTLKQIGTFVQDWAIPFLDKYRDFSSLIQGYESGDSYLRGDRRFYLYIAAAYVQLCDPAKAIGVLEDVFGRPGSRRQYARAFEYVRSKIAAK